MVRCSNHQESRKSPILRTLDDIWLEKARGTAKYVVARNPRMVRGVRCQFLQGQSRTGPPKLVVYEERFPLRIPASSSGLPVRASTRPVPYDQLPATRPVPQYQMKRCWSA